MATFWFVILSVMIVAYAVLDGFDLGVGAIHLAVARNDTERRTALNAIGPVWDANEVWLLGVGVGALLAFPRAFAVGFSGFYLPLMIVLWLLMGRGIALEFRHHIVDPMWQGAWDVVFSVSSLLLALLYGVAVGNIVTGVPIDEHGWFQGLFAWMLNPYALLMGLFSLALLVLHGAHYLSVKTDGALQERAYRVAGQFLGLVTALAVVLTLATFGLRPELLANYRSQPVWLIVPLLAAWCVVAMFRAHTRHRHDTAFLASAGLIASLLVATAIGAYPYLLRSHPFPERSLTIANSAASLGGLVTATYWLVPGVILILVYQIVVYRAFAGKTSLDTSAHY
ncbi:MAG TPA: cytochrome d ubiquinol oxidase subunit II [bacterium]|nr:cytochrome d ubiquinol oxidase subunit II [bacterium]